MFLRRGCDSSRIRYLTTLQMYAMQLAIFVTLFLFSNLLFANPVLDHIAAGNVTVQQTQHTTTINQTSQKAIINWQSFNIAAPESTHFKQPDGGVALNRINPSQGASEIYGRLTATGKIILVNPAGIFFGPNAYVNVGGLIASTSNITDEDFLNNYYRFSAVQGYNGAVVNQGHIIAAENGLVALIGGAVNNSGMIEANMGQVVLASGESFTMSFAGNDLVSFAVDGEVSSPVMDKNGNRIRDGVKTTGSIIADGGNILITAKSAAGVLDNVINMQGVAQAKSVYKKNGSLVISGDPRHGVVRISGKLNASNSKGKGGSITVTGHQILIDDSASLNASGNLGGGRINIGGGVQGTGNLSHANAVVVMVGATIEADAIDNGNGGEIVLWSDHYTHAAGYLSARGGSMSGNGGFIETSSKQYLAVGDIEVVTTAANGHVGSWLLDPGDLTISSASNANVSLATPFQPTAAASVLNVSTLTTALASGNVTVQTNNDGFAGNGDIIINAAINYNSANSFTLSAYRHITSSLGGAVINNAGSGVVNLRADNTATGVGTINFSGGSQVTAPGGVNVYYNPVVFGTQDTIYSGGTTPTKYMLIQALGTSTDAATVRSLGAVSNNSSNWSKNFALAKDIDATATSTWNAGAGFAPIGNFGTRYTGKFDGQSFTINNLFINRPATDYQGLFGVVGSAGSVTRLTIIGASVAGNQNIGLMAGRNFGTISQVSTSGTVSSFRQAGGIIGYNDSTLINSSSSANVSGTSHYLGGVIGFAASTSVVQDVFSTGSVTGNSYTGGLIGGNHGSLTATVLGNTYSTATVTSVGTSGLLYFGGLVGYAFSTSSITNVYGAATFNTLPAFTVGGIVGHNAGSISNSYSTGNIFADTNVGGIAGVSTGVITNVYSSAAIAFSGNYAGGIVGMNTDGGIITASTIGLTYATGSITGTSPLSAIPNQVMGGIVGYNRNGGAVSNTYSAVTMSGSNFGVGGIAGVNAVGSTISNSYNTVDIYGGSTVGGIAGRNDGTLIDVYASGITVTGNIKKPTDTGTKGVAIGGLVGYNIGTITATTPGASYFVGTVNGNIYVGGAVGLNVVSTSLVNNVNVTATVNGNDAVAGAVGRNHGTVTNTNFSGTVNGAVRVGAFIATNVTGSSYTNTSVGSVVMNGLAGDNYFMINTNTINNSIIVNGTSNGNTTFDFGGYAKGIVINMNSANSGLANDSGRLIANFNNIDNLIGHASFQNTLNPLLANYAYLVRTGERSGFFLNQLTYDNYIVPNAPVNTVSSLASSVNAVAAGVNTGTYQSNATASNIPTTQFVVNPQWLIFGNGKFTVFSNQERPVMMQSGVMYNKFEKTKMLLPISPFRSMTVDVVNNLDLVTPM